MDREPSDVSDLELDAAELSRWTATFGARIESYLATIAEQPAWQPESCAAQLLEPLPEGPTALDTVLDEFLDRAMPGGRFPTSPRYLAYVPGGGLPQVAYADWLASSVNRFTGIQLAAPGLAAIETSVISWLVSMVGLPPSAGGALVSGGSLANFLAVIAARERYWPQCSGELAAGRAYLSELAHDCLAKALRLAGFPPSSLRTIASDAHSRIDRAALVEAIAADRRAGHKPFLIVGNAGNVNTGAVDELDALAELAARERLWLHVDGAYGGFFALTQRGQQALRGMERADSIALDPHKGLFLPFGTGAIVVRDPATLAAAQPLHADYLPGLMQSGGYDPCQLTPELSRPFRALRLWLPIRVHGIAAWRRALDEKLDLSRHAWQTLARLPCCEIASPPELSLFAWRCAAPEFDPVTQDEQNRALLSVLNASGRLHFSPTVVHGRYFLRLITLGVRTHRRHVDEALAAITAAWPLR